MSINTAGGFSIVQYTGTRSSSGSDTIPHGLGVTPKLIMIKSLASGSRSVGFTGVNFAASTGFFMLDSVNALDASWNDFGAAPDANLFTTQYSSRVNASGVDFVAWCWTAVAGLSAFGNYTGNAGDQTISLGDSTLTPKFILIKPTTGGTTGWSIYDEFRGFGTLGSTNAKALHPNASAAENTGKHGITVSAGSFRINTSDGTTNGSGTNYTYSVFG